MKDNRLVLPFSVILLIICLPLTVIGVYKHKELEEEGGNANHLHFFDNKLFFYDNNDALIGTYECQSSICTDAITTVDDEYLNYYLGNENTLGVFGDNNVFVNDGGIIYLYSLNMERTIVSYKMLKNYGVSNGDLIVQKIDDKVGVLDLETGALKIPTEYDFIGINEFYIFNDIKVYAALKEEKWSLIDENNAKLSSDYDYPIYDYNDNYVVLLNDDEYLVEDYEGNILLDKISSLENYENYQIIINNTNDVLVYDYNFETILKEVKSNDKVLSYNINDDAVLEIIDENENVIDTFNLYEEENQIEE